MRYVAGVRKKITGGHVEPPVIFALGACSPASSPAYWIVSVEPWKPCMACLSVHLMTRLAS
jgi:hypothetical protein